MAKDGQAAILSYQIPQESSYAVTSYISLGVKNTQFNQSIINQNTSPVWNSLEEIKQLDTYGIQQAVMTNNKILVGYKNFEKNVNLQSVQLEKLSNNTLLASIKANNSVATKYTPIAEIQASNSQINDLKRGMTVAKSVLSPSLGIK